MSNQPFGPVEATQIDPAEVLKRAWTAHPRPWCYATMNNGRVVVGDAANREVPLFVVVSVAAAASKVASS
jgi:hypothetical protein